MPIRNASQWLPDTFKSLIEQNFTETMELSLYNDGSTDNSIDIVHEWEPLLTSMYKIIINGHKEEKVRGAGYCRNRAIDASAERFLCLLDAVNIYLQK
ncbi:unnamed protein product [Didymodactylos carnosus]|uniref:Glycosyltransferase 2-like domain-containing protein n=1 Tax=Didymodactylos carnosus TaxID=1234261 RepID=A0A815BMN7_9BILA|nr:unnamed protein product [Didymodactylos carnosus]CAF4063647.1 unnamed protein product [Didymodactylos carnosus]